LPRKPQPVLAAQTTQELAQVSSKLIRKKRIDSATLKIRPGCCVNVMENKDINRLRST
jgi:hypothetical protein